MQPQSVSFRSRYYCCLHAGTEINKTCGSGTIIGSIVGSVFAVLIIIVIIVVIRLKREDINSKGHVHLNNLIERKTVNAASAEVEGEYLDAKTSIPVQSYEKESVTCAVVNKNEDFCRNRDDDLPVIPINEEQKSTVLYNMQQRSGGEEGDEEYGKVNRVEQNGPTGNVNENANFTESPNVCMVEMCMIKRTLTVCLQKSLAEMFMRKRTSTVYLHKSLAEMCMTKRTSAFRLQKSLTEMCMIKRTVEN
ncbi:hypothetical protein CHS0354_005321 [Potamilus streckersoni]|uniref:Uncharacterized protein n=1 Tax=Potamilus streckersoni TaxID=2493646 RepID=A0AAE0SGB6_9BIVA|nr:hypothetical protein CHS0354_005321 [Potamilus streckersoni]